MTVIEVEGLRKEYRRLRGGTTVAVDRLDLAVPRGGVFGFLGPNGSGKTTTIRCLLGLVRPTAGTTRMLGADAHALPSVITRVGSIVEAPIFFPTFSGRRNLELLGRLQGIPRARVNAVLERVGLGDRGEDMVKNYSLGMKQRLGVAGALLKDPELLILDEPANGLDPAGIKEIRDLIRTLGAEGRTVFLSSHQLAEVEHVCDRVAILSRGRCIASGTVAEVLARSAESAMLARVANPARAAEVLAAAGFEADVRDDGALHVAVSPTDAASVTKALAAKRLYVSELRPVETTLESVFLTLTGNPEEAAAARACPSCGAQVRQSAHFCTTCGTPLGGDA